MAAASEIEFLWCNPENWKFFGIYYCRKDPRVVVPKRWRWTGWTLNFANPLALPALIAMIAFVLLPFYVLGLFGINLHGYDFPLLFVLVFLLGLSCSYLSSPHRYGKERPCLLKPYDKT